MYPDQLALLQTELSFPGHYPMTQRLPEDYYFLPQPPSPIRGAQCVHPCTLYTQGGKGANLYTQGGKGDNLYTQGGKRANFYTQGGQGGNLYTHGDSFLYKKEGHEDGLYTRGDTSLYSRAGSPWSADYSMDRDILPPDDTEGAFSEQDDKVIVIHEHHHHHHHKNVTGDEYDEESREENVEEVTVQPEWRNEASESKQVMSKEKTQDGRQKKRKFGAFQNFFRKFYENMRRKAQQEKVQLKKKKIEKKQVESLVLPAAIPRPVRIIEMPFTNEKGFKQVKVHLIQPEVNPFLEDGFEPILEYELA